MRKFLMGLGMTVMMMGAATPAALAEGTEQNFDLKNESGVAFKELYVSKSNAKDWGSDLLNGKAIPTGTMWNIPMKGYAKTDCQFSISVVDTAGKSWEIDEINLCETDKVTFKMEGGKMKYFRTEAE